LYARAYTVKPKAKIVGRNAVLLLFLFLIPGLSFSQEKFTISGYIRDAKNGEALIGSTVLIKELSSGTSANSYGFYSVSAPAGTYTLIYNSLGYQTLSKTVVLSKAMTFNVELVETSQELQTVEINSEKENANVKSVDMSINKLDIKTIEKIPALLGEVDLVRAIQLLPGVATVGEGASGFNVRGGGIDQNLILLDEAPVYNSSHLFGFFSVFNPDAVLDVKLIKGGIPAQYGGRASSVLDVRMKNGNNKNFAVTGGVGVIFSRLAIEGPLVKDKGSFIVAARRSYIDVLAAPFLASDLKGSQFYFYDLTAKANYTFNDKNRIFISGYMGRDVFGAASVFGFNWGNATATVRWNHVFGEKLFLNTSLIYSNYDYTLQFGTPSTADYFAWKSRIINYIVKPEFTWYPNTKNTVKFGLQSTYYDFVPGTTTAASQGITTNYSLNDKFALESGIYLSDEQKIGARLILEYGLRFSYYQYLGGDTVYTFNPAQPDKRKTVAGSYYAAANTDVRNYANLEPRFSAKFDLTETSSLKFSYNRMTQDLHLISNTTASIPLDVWTPTTNNIKPLLTDQVALGYFRDFGKNSMYEASAETYYKYNQNEVDYIDGADLRLNQRLEADLLNGIGRDYGLELFLKKTKGKFTGWLSYTLSRSELLTGGVNQNNWYPSRFDHTHDLNLVMSYQVRPRLEFGANFVFMTGTPATFPTNRIDLAVNTDPVNPANNATILVPQNSNDSRNDVRIPTYNRLDLSATLHFKKKEGKRYEQYIVFSIYNVYARQNPFSIYFQQNPANAMETQAIQYSIIGRMIPGISYNFKF